MPYRPYLALSLLLPLLIAACASPPPAAQAPPTAAAAPGPAPTVDEIGTIAAAGPQPTPRSAAAPVLPTLAPTITLAPSAPPTPLEAGWWDGAACYEVFVRSFYDSDGDGVGDLRGLAAKLDYLNDGDPATNSDLGVNCIWLMPIAESPSYHGYDVTDYYTVEADYGTNDDFKALMEQAHQRGIVVILDLVLNHTSSQHSWFQDALKDPASPYRDWYLWSQGNPGYAGPWGEPVWHRSPLRDEYYYGVFYDGMPDLNYRNPAVTAEAQKISSFWLNEMGADGFRLDAIKHAIENGPVQENTPETHAWLRDYSTFLRQTKPGAFTVGEIFSAGPEVLRPYYPDQLGYYFSFDVGYGIIDAANGGAAGPYLGAVGRSYSDLPFQRWAPFLTNHDQNRIMSELGNDPGKARIAAVALLTLPGLPFIYYGEELGMLGVKPDERLRTPMQWSGEPGTGFSSAAPWQAPQQNYREVNVAVQTDDPASLLNLYRRLVQLHTTRPALAQGSYIPLNTSSSAVAAFLRQQGEETLLVVLNFAAAPTSGVTLDGITPDQAVGNYALDPLLGDAPGAALAVGDGGTISGFAPLERLEAYTGYVWVLTRK